MLSRSDFDTWLGMLRNPPVGITQGSGGLLGRGNILHNDPTRAENSRHCAIGLLCYSQPDPLPEMCYGDVHPYFMPRYSYARAERLVDDVLVVASPGAAAEPLTDALCYWNDQLKLTFEQIADKLQPLRDRFPE